MLLGSTEIDRALRELESKSDKELVLENKLTALKDCLSESENTCSAQKVQIENLQWDLCEANRSIMDLENQYDHLKVVLKVLSILFVSSLIITYFYYQNNDLLISYYVAGKNGLNALLTNPLFNRLSVIKISNFFLHNPFN